MRGPPAPPGGARKSPALPEGNGQVVSSAQKTAIGFFSGGGRCGNLPGVSVDSYLKTRARAREGEAQWQGRNLPRRPQPVPGAATERRAQKARDANPGTSRAAFAPRNAVLAV